MPSFSVHRAPAKVTWPRPSAKPPSNRATVSTTARLIICWKSWPKLPSITPASNGWSSWPPCRCSSSMTWACASLPLTAAEDLLEIIMRHYECVSTLVTSNRPVEDWGKLLGDTAAVSAMLDRLLHHGHLLKCGPRSWRTKTPPASGEKE